MIDTLRFARRLKDAGLPDAQAEAIAEGFAEETRDALVTRTYFDMRLQATREGLELKMGATRESPGDKDGSDPRGSQGEDGGAVLAHLGRRGGDAARQSRCHLGHRGLPPLAFRWADEFLGAVPEVSGTRRS